MSSQNLINKQIEWDSEVKYTLGTNFMMHQQERLDNRFAAINSTNQEELSYYFYAVTYA